MSGRRPVPCGCAAYPFPHRPGGGACYVGKHCTFGERERDVVDALFEFLGGRVSSLCRHVFEVDERCVGCYRLSSRPLDADRAARNVVAMLDGVNENMEKLGSNARLKVRVTLNEPRT